MAASQKTVHGMRRVAIVVALKLSIVASLANVTWADEPEKASPLALYDSDPQHLWNRLHHALFVRRDGRGELIGIDDVDPPLWHDTMHLLAGPSHDLALKLLDEFVNAGGHALIEDPLRRTVLQHDLWSVFDWLAQEIDPHRRDDVAVRRLRTRVASAIGKLAPAADEIADLLDSWQNAVAAQALPAAFDPDDPAQAFLPPDLFDDAGPWVCLKRSGPDRVTAKLHTQLDATRSAFLVFLRLPGANRAATLKYLETLNLFRRPILLVDNPIGHIVSGNRRTPVRGDAIRVNPDLPQFPVGTQVALARTMLAIDDQNRLVPTGIVEMVQTRVYLTVNEGGKESWQTAPMQAFHEVRFRRLLLYAGQSGGLTAVKLSEPHYHHFFAAGERYQFEQGPSLLNCIRCHQGNGIHSLNTYAFGHGLAEDLAPKLSPTQWKTEFKRVIQRKRLRYDWGLLRGQLELERQD